MWGQIDGHVESGWTADDVAAHLAVTDDLADRCSGCGHRLSESTHPDNQFGYDATPVRCFACLAAGQATRDWDGPRDGLLVRTSLDG